MFEVLLDLKLDSFLVNSTGDSAGLSNRTSTRVLRFSCGKILSARQLTEDTPSADFEFLGSSGKKEDTKETDKEFDEKFVTYLSSHSTVDISRVTIAYGSAGYCVNPKEGNNGEVGRLFINNLPDQSNVDVELVLKQDEFDAVWELTTKQQIQNVIGTLVCFKPKHPGSDINHIAKHVAGVLSCSLQMLPNA
jgi:hypothetical protein